MITSETMYNVKNRSSSVAVYRIPETGLRREFQPGEVKRISFGELEKLTYQPGGRQLLEEFLQILEDEPSNNLNIRRELEYNMSEAQVRDLLLRGSLDAFLDALDFAPMGVIDLIKVFAVQLPLTDLNKRKALKEKTGFDVDTALRHIEEERETTEPVQAQSTERRVKPAEAAPGRRTTPDYKVTTPVETPEYKVTSTTPEYKVINKPEYKVIETAAPSDSEL